MKIKNIHICNDVSINLHIAQFYTVKKNKKILKIKTQINKIINKITQVFCCFENIKT